MPPLADVPAPLPLAPAEVPAPALALLVDAEPLAEPLVAAPEVDLDASPEAATFSLGWPVAWSRQWVAAEMLPPALDSDPLALPSAAPLEDPLPGA